MVRFIKTRTKVIGLHPGSLVYFGDSGGMETIDINLINYTKDSLEESQSFTLEKCVEKTKNKDHVTWIEFQGLWDKKVIEAIGIQFGIHQLLLEDVLNVEHRPKIEEMDDMLFSIIKVLSIELKDGRPDIKTTQASLFFGDGFVLSFYDKKNNLFEPVKERIRNSVWKIRERKADYLFCAILDFLIDQYYLILDVMEDHFEKLQDRVTKDMSKVEPIDILSLKSEFLYLRKTIFPIKENLNTVIESNHPWIESRNLRYFKDVQDHVIQIVEIIDYYNEMNDSLMDFYQNTINTKMNEVMKVLTIFASIFIPLTFLVGIYGMNFKFIPELDWKYGYFFVWVLFFILAGSMLFLFKKKKWL